jgi:hemerythrin-like domain-containing protein
MPAFSPHLPDLRAQDGPPDALALLRADHQQLRLLFAHCERLRGLEDEEETLAELVDDLCDALIVHTMLEEELFYPALRAASGDDELFDDAELEHAGARELISQLEVMYPGDEHFDATLSVLAEEVEHHIAQEESEMFEVARAAGVDLLALGQRLALRQAQLEDDMCAPATAFDGAPPHDGRRTPPRAPD